MHTFFKGSKMRSELHRKIVMSFGPFFCPANFCIYYDFANSNKKLIDLCMYRQNIRPHPQDIIFLLDHDADVHARDVALRWASRNGYLEVVKVLLSAGADVHANDDEALRGASFYGRMEVVELLILKGANIHARNDEALRDAILCGSVNTARFLLSAGADVHFDNDCALIFPSRYNHLEMVKLLLSAGAIITEEVLSHAGSKALEVLREHGAKRSSN